MHRWIAWIAILIEDRDRDEVYNRPTNLEACQKWIIHQAGKDNLIILENEETGRVLESNNGIV